MVTQQQASLNSQTYQWKSTCIQLKQPAQILVWICMKWCFHVHTNWQHKVKLKRSLSAAEVVQDGWSALFVAQLHKGGVISFRITQIKHTLTVQIDFLQWKRPFINNDFTAHWKMGYFYLTVGIKCFCQCTMKGINHLCILLSSQKKVLQSYVKNGCRPTSQLPFCFSYELFVCQHVALGSFGTMTRLGHMGWSGPEDSCSVLHKHHKVHTDKYQQQM